MVAVPSSTAIDTGVSRAASALAPRREASGRMPVATRTAWGGNRCLSAFSWSSTAPTRTGWLDSGPPRWAMSSPRPRLDSLPGTTSTVSWGCPRRIWSNGADRISDPEGHGPSIWFHVVPDAKAVKNRLHLDIHASGERTDPIETRRKRVERGGQPAGQPGCHHHWRIARGRAGPLRGRDEGPGRQRVRYQLTASAEARISYLKTASRARDQGIVAARPGRARLRGRMAT